MACWGRGAWALGAAWHPVDTQVSSCSLALGRAGLGGALQERAGRGWHRARGLPSNNSLWTA